MEEKLSTGDKAPIFSLPNQDNKMISLEDYLGQWVILYFYPRNGTRGCTTEAKDFTEHTDKFKELGAVVLAISPDSVKSHKRFMEKNRLRIELLSDPDHKILEMYGAWGKKRLYGREYMGIIRSTYIIAPSREIAYIWPKVKVKGHAENVMKKLIKLKEDYQKEN